MGSGSRRAGSSRPTRRRAAIPGLLAGVIDPRAAYAVRSSADVEDGASHSFAGQFRSILDVQGVAAVADAVALVRASADEPAVRAYAAGAGLDPDAIRVGVVVQAMVDPVVSGVAFSRNPLSGLDEVVIEAIPGRGDALLGHGATPDRWIHRWGELTERPAGAAHGRRADRPRGPRDPPDRRGLRPAGGRGVGP